MKKRESIPGESHARAAKPLDSAFLQSGNGRRSDRRYPVDLAMRCKLVGIGRSVTGRVRDISCAGVCFVSSEILPKTAKVEILIDWPVLLNGVCRLQLRGYGRIVRSDVNATAAAISRFQFYTAGSHSTAASTLAFPTTWGDFQEKDATIEDGVA